MKKFDKYETAQIKRGTIFEQLPKGAYVIKIKAAKEEANKNSEGSHIKVEFDIAEGEYKDFYLKQFESMTDEDKKWPYDGVYNLVAPDDNSPQWMINNFGTFVAALEDSNEGYHWNWDETKWKGLVIGSLFRIEQTENNGNIYDHTRPFWFKDAQAIRDNKYGRLPKDKLISAKDDFVSLSNVPGEDELPFA